MLALIVLEIWKKPVNGNNNAWSLSLSKCPQSRRFRTGSIGVFAATTAFFILKGVDFVFVLTEAFKKWQFEKGVKKGQNERDRLVMQWFESEKKKGPEGFQSPPPFLDNGHTQ